MFNAQQIIMKSPPPDSPLERTAWETVKAFWEQAAAPTIENMLRGDKEETRRIKDAMDSALRTAEVRMQAAFDEFQKSASELRAYVITTEQRAGRLEASDGKQDQSISDLWGKVNALAERVRSLESGQAVTDHVVNGIQQDIHGNTAVPNAPGMLGTLQEIKAAVIRIEHQQAMTNSTVREHDHQIATLTKRTSESGSLKLLKFIWKYRWFWFGLAGLITVLLFLLLQLRGA